MVCDHCEYAYEQDEVELEDCTICGAALCPFCYVTNNQAGAVCRKKHDDPDSFPEGNQLLLELNLTNLYGNEVYHSNIDLGRIYYFDKEDELGFEE